MSLCVRQDDDETLQPKNFTCLDSHTHSHTGELVGVVVFGWGALCVSRKVCSKYLDMPTSPKKSCEKRRERWDIVVALVKSVLGATLERLINTLLALLQRKA